MASVIASHHELAALLSQRGLCAQPSVLTAEQVAALNRHAHVSVEATFEHSHVEAPHFAGVQLDCDDAGTLLTPGVRYRVDGVLSPAEKGPVLGDGGARLRPSVIEALTQGRLTDHAGTRISAYRSLGSNKSSGYGDQPEPRESKLDVLSGEQDGITYVAKIHGLCRYRELDWIQHPLRSAWRALFPSGSSLFRLSGPIHSTPVPSDDPLPRDPEHALRTVHERLVQSIQNKLHQLGAQGVLAARSGDEMFFLRLGEARVLRQTAAAVDTVLWEHTMARYPPEGVTQPNHPPWLRNALLSGLMARSPLPPVHREPTRIGDRWLMMTGQLLRHLSDQEVTEGLREKTPAQIADWMQQAALRASPSTELQPDWGLVVMEVVPHTQPRFAKSPPLRV